jgi:hypothetical protein
MLARGSRVFVNLPKRGYVGVGVVTSPVVPVTDVLVERNEVPILRAPLRAQRMGENAGDPELCEHVVCIQWLKTVPVTEACWEQGLFAIQHTACRLRSQFTIDRVSQHFGIQE